MKRIMLALAATTTFASLAAAQGYPYGPRLRPLPPRLEAEEARDFEQDQLDRRHEAERARLRIDQKADARLRGLDADEDD